MRWRCVGLAALLLWAAADVRSLPTPHYVDGVHQAGVEETPDKFMEHSCVDLLTQFGVYYGPRIPTLFAPQPKLERALQDEVSVHAAAVVAVTVSLRTRL